MKQLYCQLVACNFVKYWQQAFSMVFSRGVKAKPGRDFSSFRLSKYVRDRATRALSRVSSGGLPVTADCRCASRHAIAAIHLPARREGGLLLNPRAILL